MAEERAALQARVRAAEELRTAGRRELLELLPASGLRDIESAAQCQCACHPRPADPELHDAGASCQCQQTPQERQSARRELATLLSQMSQEEDFSEAQLQREAHEEASRLGASISHVGGAAPFVARGVVDGRAFCLRERHAKYQVYAAGDDDPLSDPWEAGTWEGSLLVATGSSDELCDEDGRFCVQQSVRVAVQAVRVSLRRRHCAHAQSDAADWFCRDCGELLHTAPA